MREGASAGVRVRQSAVPDVPQTVRMRWSIYSTNPRPQAYLPQNISVEVGATGYNEENKKSQTRGGNRTVLRSGVGMKRHQDDGDIVHTQTVVKVEPTSS